MFKLSRRRLLLSTAAFAAASGVGIRTAFAQSDATATIRVLMNGGDAQLKALQSAAERFKSAYPNVTVELAMDPISTGWGDYVTKVLSQFNAGNAYDIYGTAIETFQTFASRDLFLPLDDFVAANPTFSDFAPSLFDDAKYKGKLYFIPASWNNIMINYNRDLFDKAGVAYPAEGWTWEQFRDVAKTLTVKDGAGNVTQWGYEVPNQNFFIQPWFFSNGTGVLNDDWTASNMLDPKVAESLQFLHDLIHVDGVSPIPGNDTMDNQFLAGQVAMISRGHWIMANVINAKLNMDVAIPPAKESDTTVIGFGAVGVAKTSANPQIAMDFVKEITSEQAQFEDAANGGSVPGRKSVAETPEFLAFPPSAQLYYQTLPHTKAVPSPANFQEVEKIFIRYYTAMMADEVSIADGCQQAHDELTASFDRLKQQLGG